MIYKKQNYLRISYILSINSFTRSLSVVGRGILEGGGLVILDLRILDLRSVLQAIRKCWCCQGFVMKVKEKDFPSLLLKYLIICPPV